MFFGNKKKTNDLFGLCYYLVKEEEEEQEEEEEEEEEEKKKKKKKCHLNLSRIVGHLVSVSNDALSQVAKLRVFCATARILSHLHEHQLFRVKK